MEVDGGSGRITLSSGDIIAWIGNRERKGPAKELDLKRRGD